MADQRLFFALWPEARVRDEFAALAHASAPGEGRRHRADDLHMTLVFLGQVDPSRRQCIEGVANAIRASSFELTIDHTGFWSRPRIFWAAPGATPEPLKQLVHDLNHGLRGCGFEPEQRSYKPHVTLYRKARHAKPTPLPAGIQWPVREFVLASSANPGSSSTRYQVLRRWALDDAGEETG
ncbi:MAG: RNA 2',3'-cyclic phosphodiesterase [Candidatus Thiodiazotropha sp. (ex Dulcina madagascariensis)]|nr:RNA 2',3'-cyclic phosphodiesterase [Candidatus Thiodiazotropha sp. (ex Dulcina madagascariensis)]